MSFDSNLAGLLQFIDWMADKGYAPANTASSRKAAANKVISSLGEDEGSDVLALDVEDAIARFATKHGGEYSTESLQSYKSRLRTALDDFRDYKSDPVGFRPAGRTSIRSKTDKAEPKKKLVVKRRIPTAAVPSTISQATPLIAQNVVPVPIREDVVVKIGNLPFDLTADEAKKIANVILAYGGAL
ncbi:hypothetical protein [Parerythrobacter lacustris]|uniref:Core-binding (CB) domain-containing protein n=1 Tax=Parerythrobacter lacustris TaxID=2969984 RepID=A0ABT1XNH3_9SPHN|nr:hypothetical protein [Parerythrobacter lacustris]MCR2833208.1 hypothetical protein [Parerythrobacter lacustris]